jgi:phosphoglycolate phosphatase-like HAD superfamily hydrolase
MFSVAAAWGYLGEHAIDLWGAHAVAHAPADLLQWLQVAA